jgi:hypothetical protein
MGKGEVNLTTCQQYATSRGVAVPTVTLHARKLGIEKMAGVYLFTPAQCTALDASIVGKVGRPKNNTEQIDPIDDDTMATLAAPYSEDCYNGYKEP